MIKSPSVALPTFSWEKPIEEEILEYVVYMRQTMEGVARRNKETGWFANNRLSENAQKMAGAYLMVENHIIKEIKKRN